MTSLTPSQPPQVQYWFTLHNHCRIINTTSLPQKIYDTSSLSPYLNHYETSSALSLSYPLQEKEIKNHYRKEIATRDTHDKDGHNTSSYFLFLLITGEVADILLICKLPSWVQKAVNPLNITANAWIIWHSHSTLISFSEYIWISILTNNFCTTDH